MTPGKLRKKWPDATIEATVSPDGWASADARFAGSLDVLYPVGGTAAGYPWVRAFWDAVTALKAEVLVEPEPDPSKPGMIF